MIEDIKYDTSSPVLYTPNYEFLRYILQKKTDSFEKGLSAATAAYSSVLNAGLTKDENKVARDNYIKQAQEQMKKVAGTDLSLQQNVASATGIFSTFWDDKDILADYADTKNQNSEIQRQLAIENSPDKEIRDTYSPIPLTLMQERMNKIKTAKRGDMSVYENPIVKATQFYNIYKEAAQFLKENDSYKISSVTAFDGRIITTVNGPGTVQTFEEFVRALRGEKYRAQDEMMGQYQALDAIKNIQNDYQQKGITLSEEAAKTYIPDYYRESKIKSLQTYNKQLSERIENLRKKGDEIIAANGSPDQLNQVMAEIDGLKGYMKDNEDEITGVWNNPGSDKYKEYVKNISFNPSRFFAQLYSEHEIDKAARRLASNQSQKVDYDQGYWKSQELKQQYDLKQDELANDRLLKQMEIEAKGGTTSSTSTGSGRIGGVSFSDIDGNGIPDEKETGSVSTSYNMPSVERAKDAVFSVSAVSAAKDFLFNKKNEAIANQFNVLQTQGNAIVGKYITSNEAAIIKNALATNKYDAQYQEAVNAVVKRLKDAGIPDDRLKGPTTILRSLTSKIEEDLKNSIDLSRKHPENAQQDAQTQNKVAAYLQMVANDAKLDDLYAKEKNFSKAVDAEMSKDQYSKIRIKNSDGSYKAIDEDYVISSLGISHLSNASEIAKAWLNGQIDVKTDTQYVTRTVPTTPNYGNDFQNTMEISRAVKSYYFITPDGTGKVDATGLVNNYGTSKEVKENLDAANKMASETMRNEFLNLFRDKTGYMGRVLTYGSDETKTKMDMGDIIANDILGAGKKYEYIDDNPLLGLDEDDIEFSKKLFDKLKTSPESGLNKVQLYTISPYNPNRRAATFRYSIEQIKKVLSDKEFKDNEAAIAKLADVGFTVEIRGGETIKGFPEAGSEGYYDMLLSENVGKSVIKNTELEEKLGVKYEMYKDQGSNLIYYKASVLSIFPNPNYATDKTQSPYLERWIDPQNPDVDEDYSQWRSLPPGSNVEEFVNGLRQNAGKVYTTNSKTIRSVVQPKLSFKEMYPDLWRRYQKL